MMENSKMVVTLEDKKVFVCGKCKSVEASDSVRADCVIDSPEYQDLSLDEMMGNSDSKKITMMCSSCNNGVKSNFTKQVEEQYGSSQATSEEIAMASYSKYNFITPYDHPEGCLIKDDSKRSGYKLAPTAIGIYNQMAMYAVDNNLKGFLVTQHPLYNKWVEEGENFDIKEIINFTGDIGKHIREIKLNGGAVETSSSDAELQKLMDNMPKEKKHWKEEQSEEEKEQALKKAQLKRDIKDLKKQLGSGEDDFILGRIEELRKEYVSC